jgi:NodT family efflux transporter outer membrane factor (OMF) lipoprotein
VKQYTSEPQPDATVAAGGQAQRFRWGTDVSPEWWHLFKSASLDAVMAEALTRNPNLQAAQANLLRSQDNLRAGYGVFFPQISGQFAAEREKFATASFGGFAPRSPIFNLFTLAASASYTLDIFGGERRQLESLQAQVGYERYELAATWLTLSSNVVNTVVAKAGYEAEAAITQELIDFSGREAAMTQAQAEGGAVAYASVFAIQAQVANYKATLPPLLLKAEESDHLLATLAGHEPADWKPIQVRLSDLALPPDVPVTVPSQLVQQRPDILAAEASLHSNSAQIGVATAALLPTVTLSGAYGQNSLNLADLFAGPAGFWNFGANVAAPLFNGGTLWFQRKAAIDAWQQSAASYRQTVLTAFEQVADTLRALDHDAETLLAASEQLDAASRSLHAVQANYAGGTANYVQVLIADLQYQAAALNQVQAQAQRLQDTVALFVALGGGWSGMGKALEEPPRESTDTHHS